MSKIDLNINSEGPETGYRAPRHIPPETCESAGQFGGTSGSGAWGSSAAPLGTSGQREGANISIYIYIYICMAVGNWLDSSM